MTRQATYDFRPADREDIPAIAALFREVYPREEQGFRTHECQDPELVRASFDRGDIWVVATAEGEGLVGCAAGVTYAWDRIYESCRSIVLPRHRKHGLMTRLLRLSMVEMRTPPFREVIVGWCRGAILGAFLQSAPGPAVICGHDGGANFDNDCVREAIFACLSINPRWAPRRIVPETFLPASPFIEAEILAPLSYRDVEGVYPSTAIVGPPGMYRLTREGCRIDYNLIPEGRSLHVTALSGGSTEGDAACQEFASLLQSVPGVEKVFAYVLADKVAFIRGLKRHGFTLTAYLPLWHYTDRGRCDCVQMTRCRSEVVPTAPRYEPEARRLVEALEQGL